MVKLDWEKRNIEEKAKKVDELKKPSKKKNSDVDCMLRIKSFITDIENTKWLKKRSLEKQKKFKQRLYKDLAKYHDRLIAIRKTYKDSEIFKKVENILFNELNL